MSLFGESAATFLLRLAVFALGLLCLEFLYLGLEFKGLNSAEAMDMAQEARRFAAGQPFQTDNIHPLGIWLLKEKGKDALLENHPDMVNPPLYPALLGAWLKIWSPRYDMAPVEKEYRVFDGDLAAGVLGTLGFLAGLLLLYVWVAQMADPKVGTVVFALCAFSNLLWQWAISGTAWGLLFLLTVALGYLVFLRLRSPGAGGWFLAMAIGAVIGLGFLTRYAYALFL
ncbi:MAG: hypothetical protein JO317_04570, partial [Verrucomicrobiae bacterium]|nr:hypothetical protein [Verrucomicrobiae bacterium]